MTLGSHRDRRPGHRPDRTVELADRIIPALGFTRSGLGQRPCWPALSWSAWRWR